MKSITDEYLSPTFGIQSSANQEGFNDIVFTTWLLFIKHFKGNLTKEDRDFYQKHIDLNNDEFNLYAPKHSHDNTFYKLIGLQFLGEQEQIKRMSLLAALKGANFRPWDAILLCYIIGNPLIKLIVSPFMFITSFFLLRSAKNVGKIRPALEDRYKWWFKRKVLKRIDTEPHRYHKIWITHDGSLKVTHHMQNDGKHLVLFKLLAFRHLHKSLDRVAEKVHNEYKWRYGEDYLHEIIFNYSGDKRYPLVIRSKGLTNVLEKK